MTDALPVSYWTRPYHPARAFWLARGLYVLLALDALLLMVEHAGRYGVGGFNVAHFAWLNRAIAHASPREYLALLTAAALLALCGCVRSLSRLAQAALLLSYTLAWAISQHDSYQHHYFLSWLLAWQLLSPRPGLAECALPEAFTRGPGLALSAMTCAVVYAFTAVSKSSAAWQSGAVLRQLARTPGPFSQLSALDGALGSSGQAFRLAAGGVLALQVVVAVAYVLAPLQDSLAHGAEVRRTRAVRVVCRVGWLGALSFHLLTELQTSFSIGWFSYYMIWVSVVMFAPSVWLVGPSSAIWRLVQRLPSPLSERSALPLGGVALLLAVYLLVTADLPGVPFAVAAVGLAYLSVAAWDLQKGRVAAARDLALSLSVSLAVALTCLTWGHVRFDYYRRLAGELRRMGQLQPALQLYRKAEQHAPGGASRAGVMRAIERELSQQRGE